MTRTRQLGCSRHLVGKILILACLANLALPQAYSSDRGARSAATTETNRSSFSAPPGAQPDPANSIHSFSSLRASLQPAPIAAALKSNGKIAFASNRDGNYEIYTMNADGSGPTRLTTNAADDVDPTWSPDGTKIAFLSKRDDSFEIYVMNADGSNQTRLTNNSNEEFDPAWSPDGAKIAFTSYLGGDNYEIYVMDANGSNPTRLTTDPEDDSLPTWSPDSTKIAFASYRNRNYEIYVMSASGANQSNISNNPAEDLYPAWSPDGTKIAFSSEREDTIDIYVMNASGANQTKLISTLLEDLYPTWSPDGTKIAFMVGIFVGEDIVNNEIYVANADGGGQTQLTSNFADDINPDWQAATTPTPTPTPGPAPTPTPTAGVQAEVRTWTLSDATSVYVKIIFADASYRVADWGQAARSGTDFVVNLVVERTPGAATVAAQTTTAHIYALGALAAGNYTFTVNNGGTLVKSQAFVVSAVRAANPIDAAREFVRWQYKDFLSREPDGPGWDHWTREITQCGDAAGRRVGESEAQCTDRKRANTSGAFFLSPEFQNTGYFAVRVYLGALGRMPKFSEWAADAQGTSRGIVVNNSLAPDVINTNKRAFADAFVGRAEFKTLYDALTDGQYVDKLFATTGVTPTDAERRALIDGLASGAETRATVLFKVVDGTQTTAGGQLVFQTAYGKAFYDRQFNPAFVLMQYFGYMQRDPDEAGYSFWLAKLNSYGNFTDAEMVKSFIVSPEYRSRFGQP